MARGLQQANEISRGGGDVCAKGGGDLPAVLGPIQGEAVDGEAIQQACEPKTRGMLRGEPRIRAIAADDAVAQVALVGVKAWARCRQREVDIGGLVERERAEV